VEMLAFKSCPGEHWIAAPSGLPVAKAMSQSTWSAIRKQLLMSAPCHTGLGCRRESRRISLECVKVASHARIRSKPRPETER
jgi:hypothetical protein